MKLVVLGATGRTGRLVVEQALARNHTVTAVTRRSATCGRARVVIGDPLRADVLVPALVGGDGVISCLGHRSRDDAALLRDAAAAALYAMARAGVRRYLVVSQGLLFPKRHVMFRLLRVFLRRQLADSDAMERLVRASAVEWTIARPPRLTDGTSPRGYRAAVDARPRGGWSMQRTDLANFLLDAAERGAYARTIVGVA